MNLAEGGTTNVHKARSDGFGPPRSPLSGAQQVGFPAAISEHFDVIDLHRPSDLHHDLVEK